jgi:hypothetical protein
MPKRTLEAMIGHDSRRTLFQVATMAKGPRGGGGRGENGLAVSVALS